MGWFSSITSIIDKLLPSRKRRDVRKLQSLKQKYAKALKDGQDTDAAVYRKQLEKLREAMKYEN